MADCFKFTKPLSLLAAGFMGDGRNTPGVGTVIWSPSSDEMSLIVRHESVLRSLAIGVAAVCCVTCE